MNREPGLALLLIAIFSLLVFTVCSGNAKTSEHVDAAESLQDSLDALGVVRDAAEATAAQQDTLVAELRASLEAERDERVAERAGYRASIATEQAEHETLIDSVLSRVDSTTAEILARAQVADSLVHENYERVILAQDATITDLDLELVETRRQVLFAQRGWDVEAEALQISIRTNARWEAAYRSQKRKGTVEKVVGSVLLVLALAVR